MLKVWICLFGAVCLGAPQRSSVSRSNNGFQSLSEASRDDFSNGNLGTQLPVDIFGENFSRGFNLNGNESPITVSNAILKANRNGDSREKNGAAEVRLDTVTRPIETIQRFQEEPSNGFYAFLFETENGILRQESGAPNGPNRAVVQQGSWSFTFPDGTPAQFDFVADEFGYRVNSPLLPTPPPLPAHAIEQLEKAEREREAGIFHDGQYKKYTKEDFSAPVVTSSITINQDSFPTPDNLFNGGQTSLQSLSTDDPSSEDSLATTQSGFVSIKELQQIIKNGGGKLDIFPETESDQITQDPQPTQTSSETVTDASDDSAKVSEVTQIFFEDQSSPGTLKVFETPSLVSVDSLQLSNESNGENGVGPQANQLIIISDVPTVNGHTVNGSGKENGSSNSNHVTISIPKESGASKNSGKNTAKSLFGSFRNGQRFGRRFRG